MSSETPRETQEPPDRRTPAGSALASNLANDVCGRASLRRIVLRVLAVSLLLILVVAFLNYGLLVPARESANRTSCKGNLKFIGVALDMYAKKNGGCFPSLYSHPEDPRRGGETWGSRLDPSDGFRLPGQNRQGDPPGVPQAELPPMTDNLHCLWMLVREGLLLPFNCGCPSEGPRMFDAAPPGVRDWWDFQYLTDCSYSYQNQLGRNTRDDIDDDVALVADKSPGRADVSPPGETDHSKWYTWNSPNHGYDGQNVLFADGHVEWMDTPNCGRRGNNIWIGEKWDETAAEWVPTGTDYDRYDQVIEDSHDSWLVP